MSASFMSNDRKSSLSLHKTSTTLLSGSDVEVRDRKTKMQLGAHKSFSQRDTLQLIMFSQLVCVANVIQPEDDQKLANNKFRENMLIQTPTGVFPEKRVHL